MKKRAFTCGGGGTLSKEYAITGGSKLPGMNYNFQQRDELGTSIFDPVLCEIAYTWFCIDGGKILDPFAGGSVRGVVANYLGYKYTGIDLSGEQIKENIKQAELILRDKEKPIYINGNSSDIKNLIGEKFDLIFTCPPYFDLEIYSDDENDLSNLDYNEFEKQYTKILQDSSEFLNEDSFAVIVISDIRNKSGFYYDLTGMTKSAYKNKNINLYNDIILVNVAGSLPIRVKKQFAYRKVGRMHQNVLVFFKGNPKNIKEKFTREFNFDKIFNNEP